MMGGGPPQPAPAQPIPLLPGMVTPPGALLRAADAVQPPVLRNVEARGPSTGPGDYADRRQQALEYGQGELEESQRKMPGWAEGENIPELRSNTPQQRIARAMEEEPNVPMGRGREDPLFRQLWRQREEEDLRKRAGIAKKRSI
jgi:hypothetical protein